MSVPTLIKEGTRRHRSARKGAPRGLRPVQSRVSALVKTPRQGSPAAEEPGRSAFQLALSQPTRRCPKRSAERPSIQRSCRPATASSGSQATVRSDKEPPSPQVAAHEAATERGPYQCPAREGKTREVSHCDTLKQWRGRGIRPDGRRAGCSACSPNTRATEVDALVSAPLRRDVRFRDQDARSVDAPVPCGWVETSQCQPFRAETAMPDAPRASRLSWTTRPTRTSTRLHNGMPTSTPGLARNGRSSLKSSGTPPALQVEPLATPLSPQPVDGIVQRYLETSPTRV